MESDSKTKQPWYYSTLFIVLSLFFCAPVGIILMWIGERFSKGARIALTAVFGVIFLAAMFNQDESAKRGPSSSTATKNDAKDQVPGGVAATQKKAEDHVAARMETPPPPPAALEAPPPPPPAPPPKPPAIFDSLPFLSKQQELCAEYDAAPNEIKKSAIFRNAERLIKRSSARDVQGRITTIETNQGGSNLRVVIKVDGPETAEFSTGLFAPIKKGTKVYNQVAELAEGQCVIFSVRKLEPSSMLERSKVCDWDFSAAFSSIKPCK